jgi:hypothetical protein
VSFNEINTLVSGVMAIYALLWAIPGVIFGATLSLGDPQRIIWIDKQLAKDVKKLHSNYQSMMSYKIMSRFMNYSLAYPVIRRRVTTDSIKFSVFMWCNTLGFWCWIIAIIWGILR